MPVKISKNANGGYKVATPSAVHAKSTTKSKAISQKRLLMALENNPEFAKRIGKSRSKSSVARPRS